MPTSAHNSLYVLIAQSSSGVVSDNLDGNHCNFGKTNDDKAWLQVRVHDDHLQVGLAFDNNNTSVNGIAADRYAAALAEFFPPLIRTRGKNHYLMAHIDCDPVGAMEASAARAGTLLASLRDAVDECGVFVDL
jgi:hypothetical protein